MFSITNAGQNAIDDAFEKIKASPECNHMVDEIYVRLQEALARLALRTDAIVLRGGYCSIGKWRDEGENSFWLSLGFSLAWTDEKTGETKMSGSLSWSEYHKQFTVVI